MDAPSKFVGYVINGRPVETKDGKAAGIIKKDPVEKEETWHEEQERIALEKMNKDLANVILSGTPTILKTNEP